MLGTLLTLGFGAAWWGFVPTSTVAAAPSPKVSEANAPAKVVRPRPPVVTVAVTTPPALPAIPDKVVPLARPIPRRVPHKHPHHVPPRILPVAPPVNDPIVTPVSDPITPPIVVDLPLPPVATDDDPIDAEPIRLPRIRTRSS